MIYSNERKLCLSGWFKENSEKSYSKSLKLQKFLLLFFYMKRLQKHREKNRILVICVDIKRGRCLVMCGEIIQKRERPLIQLP